MVLPDLSFREQYEDMMREWLAFGSRLNPAALRNNGAPYETWLRWMNEDRFEESCPEGAVPQTLYFAVRTDGRLLGAVTIRTHLDDKFFLDGGYVGYGVRPSERRKGYAKKMLRLALGKLAESGVHDVLLTCAEDNIGSENTMRACGAVYENTITNESGERVKRFWIQ
ncbi:MAG TPA: GNAT family N-acetyltransferase [Oscillospiraceae bacterium]|nr:GNAT family N-acetyltransferase [Oscillospiraceae bacterium]HPK34575.1 GNAT family N-acetyltransferase [Oscillospiraceae bacterium]HPR76742.1 GNAT family N-acetyltransferase [Oscillospiraceae bacterium]